jgi:hypothetical protein
MYGERVSTRVLREMQEAEMGEMHQEQQQLGKIYAN